MPLYEYVCRDCDREVEILVRTASDEPRCTECGSGELTKLLSVPAAPAGASAGPETPAGPCGSACECFPEG